jgi:hypothetical protein
MTRTRAIVGLLAATGVFGAAGCAGGEESGPATNVTAPTNVTTPTGAPTGSPTSNSEPTTGDVTATDPSGSTGGSTGGATGDATGGEPPVLMCEGFELQAMSWSLPDLGASVEVLDDLYHDSEVGCGNLIDQSLTFSRFDLTGDGKPDLVVTDLCDEAGVGTTDWKVYAAMDTGFAAQPMSWTLPSLGASVEVLDDLFHDSEIGCGNILDQSLTFSLLDLTGDGKSDLVVTDLCDDAGVGTTEWRVYASTGAGFAAQAMSWSLPNLGASVEVLDDLVHDSEIGCGDLLDQSLTFSLFDLTRDGKADLVVTDLCDEAGVGTTEWRVYASTGTGFAAQPMSWSLPNLGASVEVLDDLFHDSEIGCGDLLDQSLTFSRLDLTDDGEPDLVVTDLCDAAGVGTSEWRVYAATPTGFAAQPTSWSLPNLGASEEVLDDLSHNSSVGCGDLLDQSLSFYRLDLTGDGKDDLVVTNLCDAAGVGTSEWRVYAATPTGYAANPTSWSLPDLGVTAEVLDDLAHDSSEGCGELVDQSLTFSRLDVTGDGEPDLVVTDLCDAAGVGTSEWRVYAATPTGYAAQPMSWPLPDLGTSDEVLDDLFHDSSDGCGGLEESVSFSLFDLTGDGASDLVVTDLCDALGVGTFAWRVYASSCVPG